MMNKKEIFKKVGGIITELNEQYEYLSQSPENLNELELELFSANANFLSDHISILVKLNDNAKKSSTDTNSQPAQKEIVEPKPEPTENKPDPVIPEREEEKKLQFLSDWKFEIEKEVAPDDKDERKEEKPADTLLTNEEKTVMDESTVLKPDVDEDPVKEEVEEKAAEEEEQEKETEEEEEETEDDDKTEPAEPIASQPVAEEPVVKEVVISERTIALPNEQTTTDAPVPTVNDLLSRNTSQQTVGSQFNSRQVKDLKSMISLNDKLLFVRDLFNGYSLAYSEAIELLNRFDRMEAAENFLKQNYAAKNNWADKPEVADKFYEILNRRFSK